MIATQMWLLLPPQKAILYKVSLETILIFFRIITSASGLSKNSRSIKNVQVCVTTNQTQTFPEGYDIFTNHK